MLGEIVSIKCLINKIKKLTLDQLNVYFILFNNYYQTVTIIIFRNKLFTDF